MANDKNEAAKPGKKTQVFYTGSNGKLTTDAPKSVAPKRRSLASKDSKPVVSKPTPEK